MPVNVENRLREALRERGLTQADLAMMAGLPYTTVLRLSRVNSNPPLEHVLRIGAALDLEVEELFRIVSPVPGASETNEGGV